MRTTLFNGDADEINQAWRAHKSGRVQHRSKDPIYVVARPEKKALGTAVGLEGPPSTCRVTSFHVFLDLRGFERFWEAYITCLNVFISMFQYFRCYFLIRMYRFEFLWSIGSSLDLTKQFMFPFEYVHICMCVYVYIIFVYRYMCIWGILLCHDDLMFFKIK